MEQLPFPSVQSMLTDLLLWHTMTKPELARHLNIPVRALNGMLFKGEASESIRASLQKLHQRAMQQTISQVIYIRPKHLEVEYFSGIFDK